jgi:hypothetical protein
MKKTILKAISIILILLSLLVLLSSSKPKTNKDSDIEKIKVGIPVNSAKAIIDEKPAFNYEFKNLQNMKFGVYGWKIEVQNTTYYGIASLNDVVIFFKKFKSKDEYVEFITPKEYLNP